MTQCYITHFVYSSNHKSGWVT